MATFNRDKFRVKPASLRWRCKPTCFGFKTTKNAKPLDGVLGQSRAVKAIEVGLNINSPGYNIYVAGLSGTGKMTTIKALLGQLDKATEPPSDIIYVNNFADRQKPLCI